MFFLFYKFLFFFSDFLEIQRKSFYLFLNIKLGEEFSKIQPLHNSQKRTLYKNYKGLSTKENLPNFSLQTKNFMKSSSEFFNQNRNAIDFSYPSLTNTDAHSDVSIGPGNRVPTGSLREQSQKMATPRTKDRIITMDFLYRNYKFIQPTLSIEESILFSKTYCCHFYFPVRLFDHLNNHLVEIRWIFLGTLPLLTRRGHFIINGTPRVVLNQIIRSPGIYFHKETTEIKKNSRLFYAEVISKSGPWIRIEIDYKKKIWIVFQKSRISLSYFFQNFDPKFMDHQLFLYEKKKKLNLSAILSNEFFDFLSQDESKDLKKSSFPVGIAPRCPGADMRSILAQPEDQYGSKIKKEKSASLAKASLRDPVPWRDANSRFQNLYELFRKYIDVHRSAMPGLGIANFPSPSDGSDGNGFASRSLLGQKARSDVPPWGRRCDERRLLNFGKFYIKNQKNNSLTRPFENRSDEPNVRLNSGFSLANSQFTKSKQIFSNILFASSAKETDLGLNLGRMGRMRLNKRLGLSLQTLTLTPMDFFAISAILYQLAKNLVSGQARFGIAPRCQARDDLALGRFDDIDDIKNRRLKTIGELLQNQLARGLLRLQKIFENNFQKDWTKSNSSSLSFLNPVPPRADKSSLAFILWDERPPDSVFSLLNHLPINSTFKEFFHSHQLSQYLDQSNPLAEITHKRRFSCLGSGGINRETAGMEIRSIHLSHYGRICPIETPEGKNAGLVNSLTTTVHVNNNGFLETPYIEIYKQHSQNQKKLVFFSVESQEKKNVFLNPKSSKLGNMAVGIIQSQTKNFYKCKLNFIQFMAFSPQQFLSIATTCIPFIEHDDANRALMGSNMQRQALPLIHLEQPIVTTLNAFRVLSDLKDIPTTSNSGVILYASQQKISFCLNLYSKPRSRKLAMFPSVYIQSPFLNSIASCIEGCIASRYQFSLKKYKNTVGWHRCAMQRSLKLAMPVNPMSSLGIAQRCPTSLLNLEKQKSIQQTISFFKDRKKF